MSVQQGDAFMQEGRDKLTKVGFMDSLFGGGRSSRSEAAVELYIKGANQYKLAKSWKKAAAAFYDAASLSLELEFGAHKAQTYYQNAAECFQKEGPGNEKEQRSCLQAACDILLKDGKFSQAGKVMEALGAQADEEGRQTDAMIAYEKAADFHEADTHGKSSMNTCLIKVGNLAGQCGEYQKAVECFEKVATNYMSNDVMKFKVKPLWVDAGICRIGLDDLVSLKKSIQRYCDISPDFVKSREFMFLNSATDAIENNDSQALSDAVTEYDSFVRIQRWQTGVLLAAKDKIDNNEEADDFS